MINDYTSAMTVKHTTASVQHAFQSLKCPNMFSLIVLLLTKSAASLLSPACPECLCSYGRQRQHSTVAEL